MKKERKRNIKDYSAYYEMTHEFYGLFNEKGKLSIDTKRLKKNLMFQINPKIIKEIDKKPRNTAYFFPNKKHRREYNINIFNDHLDGVAKLWQDEFKSAIELIKTPKQAGDDAFLDNLSFGVLDYEECEESRFWHTLKRENRYNFVIRSMYAQFIHYTASIVEFAILSVLTQNGYNKPKFNNTILKNHLNDKYNIKLEKIPNIQYYDRFYKLWNFLKHNSLDTYIKLKKAYPEILSDESFENGEFALAFVKLTESIIIELLTNLKIFFNSFCEIVFCENIEEAQWNYDDYFLNEFFNWRSDIEDPGTTSSIYGF